MRAIECDRCGKIFEPKQDNDSDHIIGKMLCEIENREIKLFTLCDDCQKALRMFMNGRKENEECPF